MSDESAPAPSRHHLRIAAVFQGRRPDRYPICEQAFASSVASAFLGREALTGSTELHFQESLAWLQGDAAHEEFVERMYADTIALHRLFDFDILFLPWRNTARPARRIDDVTIAYGETGGADRCVCRFDPASRTYGVVEAGGPATCEHVISLMKASIEELRSREPSRELDPLLGRALREYGDEFAVAGYGGLAIPMQPAWLEASALEPELVADWLDAQLEHLLVALDAQRRAGVALVNGGGDFAFNSGPIYSPAFFDRVMAPRWKRIFDACRQWGVPYVMRSDGNLWPVARMLFGSCSPAAYYEVDADAGMDFSRLRAAFPGLVLIGNVSCGLLRMGSPAQVREAAMQCLRAAAPRFIGASANSVLHGTPPENVAAMYESFVGRGG